MKYRLIEICPQSPHFANPENKVGAVIISDEPPTESPYTSEYQYLDGELEFPLQNSITHLTISGKFEEISE